MTLRVALTLLALAGLTAPVAAQTGKNVKVAWKKTVVDKLFRSEGVGVADVNHDGKKDIISGDVWYEAPDWKMHVLAKERRVSFKDWGDVIEKGWTPIGRPQSGMTGYSESFAVFADDFNGDGWVDAIVLPFPGKECFWYENPGKKGGFWTQHHLTNSACNETPIFVDLFGTGKKYLVMAWQPPDSKGNMGEMCYFLPGKPWQRISISGPSAPGKEIPGTQRFSHGLGHGDVNGDGRIDILCTAGWWEQPERSEVTKPWKFHPANFGPACADMYVFDVDGDGKNDVISSSAHQYGFWWYQQKSPTEFVQREFFPDPFKVAKLPKESGLSADEEALYSAIIKLRAEQGRAPWKLSPKLTAEARDLAQKAAKGPGVVGTNFGDTVAQEGRFRRATRHLWSSDFDAKRVASELCNKLPALLAAPHLEIGVSVTKTEKGQILSTMLTQGIHGKGQFSLPSQTHALHFIDINGDGQKDLVTGRRWWAHGPKGDAGPNDPAYIYWFEAKKDKDGGTTFTPHEVDDDSGIGTQFAVEDIDGDGIPDIIVSNKRGVYVLIQVRTPVAAVPPRKD